MGAEGVFQRLSAMGAAAQASVPGVYAWGVTVAPAAWSHGAPLLAKMAAMVAVTALLGGVVGERVWQGRARVVALWGFVLSCALVWSAAPAALGPLRIDAPRGVAGMIGWALFAFASAAPALQGRREEQRLVEGAELAPRKTLSRGDAAFVTGGALLAAGLQVIGWKAATAERELLVRFVALAAGLAVIGGAAEVALARHAPRVRRSRSRRLRRAMAVLVALALLGLTGVLFALRG
ncbi:MAG TPA: hypothetical protein VHS09_09225 [Polyangiaceae bacterium]|jgi:hypothetical protein|nr:hypothetical protein [Polyangiaceae bacterium]